MDTLRDHVPRNLLEALKPVEIWRQDPSDPDLWHHGNGLIVNGAALTERESYYRVIRLGADEAHPHVPPQPSIALGL